MSRKNTIDLSNSNVNYFYVIGKTGKKTQGQDIWTCVCICGEIREIETYRIVHKKTKSCGCKNSIYMKRTTHGMKGTKCYNVWASMKRRCNDPKYGSYAHYGEKGITYCDKWESFEGFLEDMGIPEENKSLDRIDNNKGYFKENCRWATSEEQNSNRSTVKLYIHNGKEYHLHELWKLYLKDKGLNKSTLYSRIKNGWSLEKSLFTPKLKTNGSPKNQCELLNA
jgi:hypothetical protein